mgnify:CR=1 FL=1
MEKSVLKHTGWLMFIVVAVLLLMGLLPGTTIGTHVLRRVDILGDVRLSPEAVSEPDTLLPPPPKVKPAFVDTCRSGMTCIEDYSDSALRGMTPFYRAWMSWPQIPVWCASPTRRFFHRSGHSYG